MQAIVRVANKYRIPLYAISTGKNLGYGGSAPAYSGSVVVDLKRMNRVLEVDERNASVLVEPGVSYFDLHKHLKSLGSKLWIDCPDPGWGSVVGNAIDRGGGYTMPQYRNHFEAHCGMEIVLPDGELLRTGMGGIPNAKTWQQYKSGCGPWVDGMFSQGNYGIVTKMGFWLMPEPEGYLRATVRVPRYKDLIPLVDTLNYLENARITNGFPDVATPLLGYPPTGQVQNYIEGTAGAPMTRCAQGAAREGRSGLFAGARGLWHRERHRVLGAVAHVLRSARSGGCAVGRRAAPFHEQDPGREVQGRSTA